MQDLHALSEEHCPEVFGLFEGTGVAVLKAWQIHNRMLARRFLNHVNFISGVTPDLNPPPLDEDPRRLIEGGFDPATTGSAPSLPQVSSGEEGRAGPPFLQAAAQSPRGEKIETQAIQRLLHKAVTAPGDTWSSPSTTPRCRDSSAGHPQASVSQGPTNPLRQTPSQSPAHKQRWDVCPSPASPLSPQGTASQSKSPSPSPAHKRSRDACPPLASPLSPASGSGDPGPGAPLSPADALGGGAPSAGAWGPGTTPRASGPAPPPSCRSWGTGSPPPRASDALGEWARPARPPPPVRPGFSRMFIVPLPKEHSGERGGIVESWPAVVATGAKFTSGLCGEAIYLVGSPREAAYFATLVNVSHIVVADCYLGRVLPLARPTRNVPEALRCEGYDSVYLANTGISCIPITAGGLDAVMQRKADGTVQVQQVGFHAVYHPDQVLPHYVVELNNKQQQRRVDELATSLEDESAGVFTFKRVDEPELPTYEGAFVEGLRAALAPKYTVDAVYHLHNPILLQRFYVALHDFQLRQSKGKKCASQNVRVKFHGSSECLSIIKHGFNRAIQAGMFGKGIYFATDPRKSCHFAPTGELMMCRVALGRTTIMGTADRELTGDSLRARGYDSVTAPGSRWLSCCFAVNRTEYAIFDPDMAYPEYLIKFTRLSEQRPFRSRLVGGSLLYKVQAAYRPLWAVLFLTLLGAVLYVFAVGVTLLITTPEFCSSGTSNRSWRLQRTLILTLAVVLELVPLSFCVCARGVRPIQTHFGVRATRGTSEASEASAPLTESVSSSDASSSTGRPPRVRRALHEAPLAVLRHLRLWLVCWHVLIVVVCLAVFYVNQVLQCPVHTMLEYEVPSLGPLDKADIDVNRNHFVALAEAGTTEAWQVEYRGTHIFTTGARSYCVAPVVWGDAEASPRCGQPFVALAACDSADDFRRKMESAGDARGGLRPAPGARPLPRRPMVQHIALDGAPERFITSLDYFQYVEKDAGFAGLNPWVIDNAATDLMARHPGDYNATLAAIGDPTWAWPRCGRHRETTTRRGIHSVAPHPHVPTALQAPATFPFSGAINAGQQTVEGKTVLTTNHLGTRITVYTNSTDVLVTDVPAVVSGNTVEGTATARTEEVAVVSLPHYYNSSATVSYTNTIEVTTVGRSVARTPVILDFTRSLGYWEDRYALLKWMAYLPLLAGLALGAALGGCLLGLFRRRPSDERRHFGTQKTGRRFRAPDVPADLPLEPGLFAQAIEQHPAGAEPPAPRLRVRRRSSAAPPPGRPSMETFVP